MRTPLFTTSEKMSNPDLQFIHTIYDRRYS
jgi:hypothetical protein